MTGTVTDTLRAAGLTKRYRHRTVVRDVSFEVHAGEIVGLLGPNGAGKTTSFHMVVGLVRPDSGRVTLGDRDLTALPLHERTRLGIGYLSQEPSVFRRLTVEQNFEAILELLPELATAERLRRRDELIEEFELGEVRRSLGETLSGGERRRVEVARSLIPRPRFLLFDEPFSGIDPIAVQEIQRVLGRLRERGIGVLLTDHNVRDTLAICQRAYILVHGAILEAGTPSDIEKSPQSRALYLGERFRLDADSDSRLD